MTLTIHWHAEDVMRAVHGKCLHEQTWVASGVSIDSRTLQKGDLFIALEGPTHDGHEFVAAAFAAGAAAAIVAHQPPQTSTQSPLIFVEDPSVALEALGQTNRARAKATLIAVTGSVGKTSTKEMLRTMLNEVGETYANEGSLNNHWGVPLSLARMPVECRFGVFELGMNHPGELSPLSRQVRPHVAMITTIEAVHMEFFPSLEAIADAKAEIFYGMSTDSTVILNADNSQYERLHIHAEAQGIKKILGFGTTKKTDARMIACTNIPGGSDIDAEIHGKKIRYRLGVPGEHLALNSVGSLLAAVEAGGDLETCAAALANYQQPKGRGIIQNIPLSKGEITIIDESYNASPVAVRFAIRVLGQMKLAPGGRRLLALADMKELGANSAAMHVELARDIIDAGIEKVFCCGEMMKQLYDALPENLRGAYAPTSVDLAPQILGDIKSGDIISIKGSNSMRMNVVVNALKSLEASPAQRRMG